MWRTEPIMDKPSRRPPPQNPIQNERTSLSKPQIFVQLSFGVSWSERHAPRNHTVTYMSRNLKNAREVGNFPRQVPPPTTNFLATSDSRQHRNSSQHHYHHHQHHHHHQHGQPQQQQQEHRHHQSRSRNLERPRGRATDPLREHPVMNSPAGDLLVESRGVSHERGRSAPPPLNDSPWDAYPTTSATLFPHPAQASRDQPQVWKALPTSPSQFRLGEDGLPWSAWAWPGDAEAQTHENNDDPPYANHPTTVALSSEVPRQDDLERVRELESLSTAMMTVDNGFENQWWYQGPREVTNWWPQNEENEDHDPRPLSTTEAMLLSTSEPPVSIMELNREDDMEADMRCIVSPISDWSPPSHLQRSLTTRSEELWLER
ncbi:hypothetical protein F4810DRAFT_57738 [Camillea tinctor]|nr:hypothetical protein F4810DRAFT_57738 [Camillea tinctor]